MTIGWRTLDVGEKALIYSRDGSARIMEGPQRLFLFREVFTKMICHSANQKEYLEIKYRNGDTENLKGPCIVHMNKIVHISVRVKDLISLDANEALVVYSQSVETQKVVKRILLGPTLFMFGENEWLHNFSWHGTDPDNKTRMIPNKNNFTVLKVIADQFYYNVDEVRTADDAILRVKLMMFFELTNIERMLNSTNDPMADFINCLCADVIAFAAKRTYEEFTETASDLNNLESFSHLMERSQDIGYSVSKVVFRGYFAHDKLQMMHDVMIVQRTELRLKYEREVQEQELIHKKLQADTERLAQGMTHLYKFKTPMIKSVLLLMLRFFTFQHCGQGVTNGIRNPAYSVRNTAAGDLEADRLALIFMQWATYLCDEEAVKSQVDTFVRAVGTVCKKQRLELEKLLHAHRLEKDDLHHTLNLEKERHEKMLDKQKMENEAKLSETVARDRLDFQYLNSLAGLNVNVTDLLVTQAGKPARVTHIRAVKEAANIHIHHNDMSAYRMSSPIV